MPYLRSTPNAPSRSLRSGGRAPRSVVTPPMAYGLTSSGRPAGGASSPTSVPAAETRKTPPRPPKPAAEIGISVR